MAFALSAEDVADLAGLPVDAVRGVEKDQHRPTANELARIADALAVDPAALWRGEAPLDDPARGTVRFLAGPGLNGLTARDHRLLARAAEVGRVGQFLWNVLGKTPTAMADLQTVTPISWEMAQWEHGYALGEAARVTLDPTREPIPSVQGLLEDFGVHVMFVDFQNDDAIGASLSEPDALPVLLLNRRHSRVSYPVARRSVMAHELCHVLHDSTDRNIVSVVSRESEENAPVEQRANGFAPAFLAPPSWLELEGGDDPVRVVDALASTWLLSWEGGCWHAKNAKLIPADVADSLRRPHGWRSPEVPQEKVMRTPMGMFDLEVEPTPLVEGLVSELIVQAVSEGEIGRGRAEEILSIR